MVALNFHGAVLCGAADVEEVGPCRYVTAVGRDLRAQIQEGFSRRTLGFVR
jgi:hypothetical protein